MTVVGLTIVPRLSTSARAQDSPLTLRSEETNVHILPTVNQGSAPLFSDPGPLLYSGGPIMPSITTYAIFWNPPKLQDGTPTSIPAHYQAVLKNVLTDYPGHGLSNNNTQYFQTIGTTTYIQNAGKLGGFFVDTSPYPPSGCSDPARPSGCLSDAQVQAEIKKIMAKKAWKPVITNMFLVFTSPGEGTCIGSACSYTTFCAYHGFISSATKKIIYANMPYGDLSVCQVPGPPPSPNGDSVADAVASSTSHEVTEAVTDPLLSAWFTALGNEIGDLCAYDYGSLTWDGGFANQLWNGNFYLLQQEYDNHMLGCVQVGP